MTSVASNSAVTARSAAELSALVSDAVAEAVPLVDYGIAHAGLGHAPPAAHTKLAQEPDPANGGIIEHYVRDLTVRAAAGINIGDLQRALALHNQFAPIDADDDITLGEAIHHNTYGPLRVGYGSLRDILLGLHYIDGDGRDIHVGGRTVKNVAGYDLSRFLVGSLGELGIVHEATFRTYAIPEHVLVVELTLADPGALDGRATDLLLSDARPVHLSYTLRPGRAGEMGTWVAHLAYFGRRTGALVQLKALELFINTLPGVHIAGTSDLTLESDAVERAARRAWRRGASAVVKIILPPAATGAACNALAAWAVANRTLHIDALPMHGCIFAGGALDAEAAGLLDDTINHTISSLHGLRVWHARPAGAESIDPFGAPQPDWPMLAKLKRTLDPHGVLNPRRFIPV